MVNNANSRPTSVTAALRAIFRSRLTAGSNGQPGPDRPRASGWRRARRLHMGRARSPAGRAPTADRRDLGHLRRGHERGRADRRICAGRAGRSPRRARGVLEPRLAGGTLQPVPAEPARRPARALDARSFARVSCRGHDGEAVLALRPQSAGANPLRDILASSVDFARLSDSPIRLFVTATNVHTGRGRVFRNAEITPDVLLASACLPTLFQAVEIGGELYWDGGYSGNPTITPLVRECTSSDTILVQINPVERADSPRSAREILNRLNEVSFNAVLLKELRMIALLRQVAHGGGTEAAKWAAMRMHRVTSDVHHGTWLVLEAERGVGFSRHAARRGASVRRGVPGKPRCRSGPTFVPRPRPVARRRVSRTEDRS